MTGNLIPIAFPYTFSGRLSRARAPSGAASDESDDIAFGNNFGVLRGEVEEVRLVRTRIAIADCVTYNVRDESVLHRVERRGAGRIRWS